MNNEFVPDIDTTWEMLNKQHVSTMQLADIYMSNQLVGHTVVLPSQQLNFSTIHSYNHAHINV